MGGGGGGGGARVGEDLIKEVSKDLLQKYKQMTYFCTLSDYVYYTWIVEWSKGKLCALSGI